MKTSQYYEKWSTGLGTGSVYPSVSSHIWNTLYLYTHVYLQVQPPYIMLYCNRQQLYVCATILMSYAFLCQL